MKELLTENEWVQLFQKANFKKLQLRVVARLQKQSLAM